MKQNIPPAARDALARQTAADDHPSADLLNGFVEQSLIAAEKDRVTTHLAACANCREIVFLAGAAPEDELAQAAAARPQQVPAKSPKPKRRWTSWKWVVPVAALAVIAGVVIQRQHGPTASPQLTKEIVALNQPLTLPDTQVSGTVAADKTATAPAVAKSKATAEQARAANSEAGRKKEQMILPKDIDSSSQALAAYSPPIVTGSLPSAGAASHSLEGRSETSAIGCSAKKSPGAPALAAKAQIARQSSLGEPARDSIGGVPSPALHKDEVVSRARWRITDKGELERSLAAENWTRVLVEQPVFFRAVAVIGNEVWAGGSDGALFHSTDGGYRWLKVTLSADGEPARETVVSIHFDTVLQGTVTTDSAKRWSTSDGGQSWARH